KPRDLATDFQIGLSGFAFDQIRSMQDFLSRVQGEITPGTKINLVGYSLSGNVVRAIAAMYPDVINQDIGGIVVFNATGLGNFRDPSTLSRSRSDVLQPVMMAFRNVEDNPTSAQNVPDELLSLQAQAEIAPPLLRDDSNGNVYTNARSKFAEAYVSAKYSTTYSPFGAEAAEPSFAQYFGHGLSGLFETEFVANGGVHPPAIGIPIEGQPLIEPAGVFDPLHDYLSTHSLTLITDSLALQILFKELDPTISTDAITGIIKSASLSSANTLTQTAEGDSLEKAIDPLLALFLGPTLDPRTLPFDDSPGGFGNLLNRNTFYDAIAAIKSAVESQTYE